MMMYDVWWLSEHSRNYKASRIPTTVVIFCPFSRILVGFLPIMNGNVHSFPICNNPKEGDFRANDVWVHQGPPALVAQLHYLHSTPSCTNHILLMEDIRNPGFHRLIGRIFLYLRGFFGFYTSQIISGGFLAECKYHPRWHTYAATQAPWKLNYSVRCSVGRLNCAMRRYLK